MKKIDSPSNPVIQDLKRLLQGDFKKRWIIEGRILLEESLSSNVPVESIFVTAAALQKTTELIGHLEARGVIIYLVSSRIMNSISDLETPPGILGVAGSLRIPEPAIQRFAAFLYSIRDPGNLGTL